MTPPRFAVVVVNYGAHELIAHAVSETVGTVGGAVFVVDNPSTPAERAAVRELCAARGWAFVPSPANDGFGAGVNRGVRAAIEDGIEVIVLLNPDACASDGALAGLAQRVRADRSTVASPRIVTSAGRVDFAGKVVSLRTGRTRSGWSAADDDPEWADWLTGACLAFDRATFDDLGGFDERYFMYWEDVDFSRRAVERGRRLAVCEDIEIGHDQGGTQDSHGRRARSHLYYYWNCRNRLLFGRRFARVPWRRWLAATPRESWQILLRGGRRQILSDPGTLGAAVRGALAGIAAAGRPGGAASSPVPAAEGRRRGAAPPDPPGPRSALDGVDVLVAHPGAEMYGSDRVLFESVSGLVEAGARVVVALPSGGPAVAELEGRGARVVVCPTPVLRKSALSPTGLARLAGEAMAGGARVLRLLRSVRPSVVVVNTLTIPVWLLAARALGIPSLCHVHEAERSARPLIRRGLYAPLAAASSVVVNSRYTEEVLVGSVPFRTPPTARVLNGVAGPDAALVPEGRSTRPGAGAAGDPVRLLFIGRLSPRKGPQVALEALEELLRRGVPARLSLLGAVFQGYEWFEAELRRWVADHGLSGQVEFLGFRDDVWPDVVGADIVLVPSTRDEPFGDTAVEAMLARTPLVVSDTSGLREAAAGYASARFVPPEDPVALAGAVIDLLAHWDELGRLTAADRDLALSRHAPQIYRRAFAAQVARLASGPGGHR